MVVETDVSLLGETRFEEAWQKGAANIWVEAEDGENYLMRSFIHHRLL
jgi:hypothetical protein